jgi:hypothetical protein
MIEGLVRDAQTGEALAGVAVESYKLVGYPYSNHRVLKTVTDEQGRFRLVGMPKGAGNRLLLLPNDEQPYFMRNVEVPVGRSRPGHDESSLHCGIWITGRVTDKTTGSRWAASGCTICLSARTIRPEDARVVPTATWMAIRCIKRRLRNVSAGRPSGAGDRRRPNAQGLSCGRRL